MPKNKTAQSYMVESVIINVDETNSIASYTVHANVDYDGTHVREEYDLWPVANAAQKAQAQALQDLIKQYLDNQVLA